MGVKRVVARFAWELVKTAASEFASNAGREAGESAGRYVGSKIAPPKPESEPKEDEDE